MTITDKSTDGGLGFTSEVFPFPIRASEGFVGLDRTMDRVSSMSMSYRQLTSELFGSHASIV